MTKDVKNILLDQIKTAINMANQSIIDNPSDNGTCNFDSCLIEKEDKLSKNDIIKLFNECGIKASVYNRDYVQIGEIKGQADKNTRWHKTLKSWLEDGGFTCSMYYQAD